MYHGILVDSAADQQGQHGPRDAVGYLIGAKDARGKERHIAPVVLRGDSRLFVKAAEQCRGKRRYFSVTISESSKPKLTTPGFASYVWGIYSKNYLPGFPAEDFAEIDILHPKTNSWDGHKLLALAHLKSGKVLRPYRYAADYERFSWLTSLINFRFELEDPLDPKNFRPISIRERIYGKEPPQSLLDAEKEIRCGVLSRKIQSHAQVVAAISDVGEEIEVGRRGISVEIDGTRWHLDGFATTAKFRSLDVLNHYVKTYSKPFEDVRRDPQGMEGLVRRKFLETIQDNVKRYNIFVEMPPDGLIVPSTQFFADQSIYQNNIPLITTDDFAPGKSFSSEIAQFTGHPSLGNLAGSDGQRREPAEPHPRNGASGRESYRKHINKTHRTGAEAGSSEFIVSYDSGNSPQRTGTDPRIGRAVERYAGHVKNCVKEIDELAARILRLLATVPIFRKLGVGRTPKWKNPKLRPPNATARALLSSPYLKQMRFADARQAMLLKMRRSFGQLKHNRDINYEK